MWQSFYRKPPYIDPYQKNHCSSSSICLKTSFILTQLHTLKLYRNNDTMTTIAAYGHPTLDHQVNWPSVVLVTGPGHWPLIGQWITEEDFNWSKTFGHWASMETGFNLIFGFLMLFKPWHGFVPIEQILNLWSIK